MSKELVDELVELIKSRFPVTARSEARAAYPKFDPVDMRKQLNARICVDNVDRIIFLCYAGIKGGNKINRTISSVRSKEAQYRLAHLRTMLGIKEKAMGNHKAVTLSRVMACYPEITVAIVYHTNPTMIVPYDDLKTIHAEFPAIARIEVGASVVPRALKPEEKHLALALFLVSTLKKAEILIARSRNWMENMEIDRLEKAKAAFRYMNRLFDSKVLSDEMRNKVALEYGIVTSVGEELVLSAVWGAAGACAVTWLKSNYGFDVAEE